MRAKDIKTLSEDLEKLFGVPVFKEDDPVDMAEGPDFNLIFVNNDIMGMVFEEKPFLTVRGVLRYRPEKRAVTVDMGAVPFLTNGADCMGPGIVEADDDIQVGDLVWIRDVNNRVPLAIGVSERSTEDLRAKGKGKAIRTLHNVGDKLWKTGE